MLKLTNYTSISKGNLTLFTLVPLHYKYSIHIPLTCNYSECYNEMSATDENEVKKAMMADNMICRLYYRPPAYNTP